MSPICINHPNSRMSFSVCERCLENVPSDVRDDLLAAIQKEYQVRSQMAEKCRTNATAVNG